MTENDNREDQPASPTTPHSQPTNSTSEQRPVSQEIRGAFFGGPIPPPDILAGYDQVVPGAADRIITMAETQSRHRQEIEKSIINSDIRNSKLGLWLGFFYCHGSDCVWHHFHFGWTCRQRNDYRREWCRRSGRCFCLWKHTAPKRKGGQRANANGTRLA